MKADIGVIGLAVMGQNLALNIESRGYTVAVYNRTAEKTRDLVQGAGRGKRLVPAETLEQFVASLASPRKVLLMVKAGKPVDELIASSRRFSPRATSSSMAATPSSRTRSAARKRPRRRACCSSGRECRAARRGRCAAPA